MQKKKLFFIFTGLIILPITLYACTQPNPKSFPTPKNITHTYTIHPTNTAAPSETAIPTETIDHYHPTITIEPFSIYTPTSFAVVPEKTFTPMSANICPPVNNNQLTFISTEYAERNNDYLNNEILDFLNKGGDAKSLDESLKNILQWYEVQTIDLTNDTVPEIIVSNTAFQVYSCRNAQYTNILSYYPFEYATNSSIEDFNTDGIPEIIIGRSHGGQTPMSHIEIIQWDGKEFTNLLGQDDVVLRNMNIFMFNNGVIMVEGVHKDTIDIDNNGTKEIILSGGKALAGHEAIAYPNSRGNTVTLMWNGYKYAIHDILLEAPHYRFQVIEDADEATLSGDYEKALELYWQAINDESLDWFSETRRVYYMDSNGGKRTIPTPEIDTSEYERLSAYAYYRIMLIKLHQNNIGDAWSIYDKLLKNDNPDNHEFVMLAALLWDDYASTMDLGKTCQTIIKAIERNPDETVNLLGAANYYVLSNKAYDAKEMCPFE